MFRTSSHAPVPVHAETGAESPLELIDHEEDLLGEAHGFGCFLFDLEGRLVLRDGMTWLYTTQLSRDKWESWVRPFDLSSLSSGRPKRVLTPTSGEGRAVLHHVIAVADDLFVGFYCNGVGLGAAIAADPASEFASDTSFVFGPAVGWETRGGSTDGWSLEANGAHVLCEDTADATVFWQGYDSYREDGRLGDLGWAKIEVDKRRRRVTLLNRHHHNPLPFRRPDWCCVRCGGNLSSDIRIRGKRAYFYYIRPNTSEVLIGLTLSDDPLFMESGEHFIVDKVRGDEIVAEKFQALQQGDTLLLFYENRLKDDSWRTGLRRYRVRP
jgi:hypothetical protein